MKLQYDFVFLTNTPSFYKVNLCNEIARTHSVLLVLYGYGTEAVNTCLEDERKHLFQYVFLHQGEAQSRNKWKTFFRLWTLMRSLSYQRVLYSGWFVPEYNMLSFFVPKQKNCVICESSAIESSFSGLKGWIKKMIIHRMGTALPSGTLQQEIFSTINYKGLISLTGGVGIFNKLPRNIPAKRMTMEKKYLYVGRLIDCKNIHFLIEQFNELGKPLTIVGAGELFDELRKMAKDNIHFLGFVNNERLKDVYRAHDVFVLPSRTEPWGLVVEEAIYWGLPVIVSNCVGSRIELVEKTGTGCVFTYNKPQSLKAAIANMELHYDIYRENTLNVDFDKRDLMQVRAYTQLIKK